MSNDQKPEVQKPAVVGFFQSLSDLADAAKELVSGIPGVIAEVSPMLPKELQPKAAGKLPAEITISFHKGPTGAWEPRQPPNVVVAGDLVGKYRLISEEPWADTPTEPPSEEA